MNVRSILLSVGVVVVVLLLVVGTIAAVFLAAPLVLADRTSHYDYEFEVETTDDLTDVTLYLPMPVGPDGPMMGDVVLRDDDYEPIANTSRVVDTEHGPMIAVEADHLEGSLEYLLLTFDDDGRLVDRERIGPDDVPENMTNKELRPIDTRYTVQVHYEWRDGGEPIDTKTPLDTEPTLAPKYDLQETDCENPYTDEDDACYDYESVVFASYETGENTTVIISGEYSGWNEWGWGLSNSYNVFTERVDRTTLEGSQEGWVVVEAELHAGEGNYPTRGR